MKLSNSEAVKILKSCTMIKCTHCVARCRTTPSQKREDYKQAIAMAIRALEDKAEE